MYSYRIITLLGAVIIARIHLVHLMNADWAPDGQQPSIQPTDLAVSMPAGCYQAHPLLLPSPEADTQFTVSRKVEGQVD